MKITSMGHNLIMALPVYGDGEIAEYIVAVDRGASTSGNPNWERYVVARMRSLDDAEWMYSLKYTADRDQAIQVAYRYVAGVIDTITR